jgi:predicted permease
MRKLRAFFLRILGFAHATPVEADFSAELESNIALHADDLICSGVSPAEARRQALIHLGGAEQTRQAHRERRTLPSLESFQQDVRFAFRQLRRSPGFMITALLTLALGIGANTAVFSLFDAVLLHPLPYRDPGQLLLVTESEPSQGQDEFGVAIQEARDYESRSRSFAAMGTFESTGFNLTGGARPLRINAAMVSPSVFPLLGTMPILGRVFAPEDDRYGNHQVVVLSWQLWRDQYASDAQIVGKTIKLDEAPYTVVGVMPPSLRFPFDGKPLSEMPDLWVPDAIAASRLDPENRLMEFGVGLIGRLKPGVSPTQAQAEIASIASAFQAEHPDVYSGNLRVEPHTYAFAGYAMQKARPIVMLLMAAVVCVLLIACANIANLLLARANRRNREMAIRGAVGADRIRLLRQCVVESLVLACGGAVLGVALAEGLLQGMRVWGPQAVTRLHDATLNASVLAFALILTLATSILFGFMPAWKMSHTAPVSALRGGTHSSASPGSGRLQNAIVIAEVALALVLLVAGGLLLRSLSGVLSSPIGFNPDGTLIVRTMFDHARYPDAARRAVVQRKLLEELSQLPGVEAVAAASHLPLSDDRQIGIRLQNAAPDDFHFAANSLISPGYFNAMGIKLLRGRELSYDDNGNTLPVAVVSQAFARQYLPGIEPLGQRFYWGDRGLFTIVGVAQDVHIAALDADPPPMVYQSMFQVHSGAIGRMALVFRTANRPLSIDEVKRVVSSLDTDLPLYDITSLSTLVHESLAQRRFTLLLLIGFASSAALLAVIGLFGVLSYVVETRRKEIGVRMALGATRKTVLALVLRRGLALGVAGCAVGLLLSAVSSPLLAASLYRVHRFDPFTLVSVSLLLMAIVLASALVPAINAASTDPIKSLRTE